MPTNAFVEPETVKIDILDDDWIVLKKCLTYGEESKLTGVAVSGRVARREAEELEEEVARISDFSWSDYSIERIAMWVVAWSFIDAEGNNVPVNHDNVRSLRTDIANIVEDAISRHIEEQEEAGKASSTKTD